jgi:hypothetical protein
MVFPFGVSVGDFIAVVELVHDVVQALKESTGSRSQFIRLILELEHLERALQVVNQITVPEGFEDQIAFIKSTIAQCGGVILDFLSKHSKFRVAFECEASKQWWRKPLKKVEWQSYKKSEVEDLHQSLQRYTAIVALLLDAFQINCTYRSQKSQAQTIISALQRFDKIDSQQTAVSGLLQNILTIASGFKSDGEQQASKVIELLTSILELQKQYFDVPPQVLRNQPVYFLDAHRQYTVFDLGFIASKDAFLYVLKDRFDPLGARRIVRGQFALQDSKTKQDIDRNKVWKAWFRPGQRVDMSMIFDDPDSRKTNCCPSCGYDSDVALDAEVQWYVTFNYYHN